MDEPRIFQRHAALAGLIAALALCALVTVALAGPAALVGLAVGAGLHHLTDDR